MDDIILALLGLLFFTRHEEGKQIVDNVAGAVNDTAKLARTATTETGKWLERELTPSKKS